jgi:chromatin remodeling complex protein RSC6
MKREIIEAKFGTGRNPEFSEPVQPDQALSAVVGPNPRPRNELMRKMWDYIREHRLQDEHQMMMIKADDNLRLVFDGRPEVSIIEAMKLMSAHLLPCGA